MAYDEQIPLNLQLLRVGLEMEDTAIARYSTTNSYYRSGYCIVDADFDPETGDISGAIEETLHTILGHGGTPDDVWLIMGLAQASELDPDLIEEEEYTPIDLGYCTDGLLTSFERLEADACDPSAVLSKRQMAQARRAFANGNGIHEAEAMARQGPAARPAPQPYTLSAESAASRAAAVRLSGDCPPDGPEHSGHSI